MTHPQKSHPEKPTSIHVSRDEAKTVYCTVAILSNFLEMSICKWVRIFKVLSFSLLLSNLESRSNFDSRKIAQNSRN